MFEGTAELSEAKLWYWDTGGPGDVILLCHPGSQSCRIWEHQRPALVEAGYRVVAYSRRRHYRSHAGPPDRPGTALTDLLELMDHVGIVKAHVLGAAAGGISALALAVEHPERLGKLILAGTILAPQEDDWHQMYTRLGIAGIRGAAPVEFLELGPAYRALNPAGTARFVELAALSNAHASAAQPLGATVTWSKLERMQVPTLLLTGEADLYSPPPLQALIAGHLPNQSSATLPGVGHAPYWEAPELFNSLVLEFLSGASPAGVPR